MDLANILFTVTLVSYGIAAALYLWRMVREPAWPARLPTAAALVGFTFHAAALIARGAAVRHAPIFNLFESLIFTAWVLMAIYLVFEQRYRVTGLGAFICLGALALLFVGLPMQRGTCPLLTPALRSPWSFIHITSSLASYACFALAFGAAVGFLLQERLLKTRRIGLVQQHLPPLHVVDRMAYEMVALGFLTLTIGIATGAVWAQTAWASLWSWDAKETWALITWLVYAVYLHMRVISGWQGKWANRLLIAGFACILITYFGVTLLSHSLHAYRW